MEQNYKTKEVLAWITATLQGLEIPFQATGGLAARCYGARRPLHDLDFYVPGRTLPILKDAWNDHITFGPSHFKDDHWDLVFMKLDYLGYQIEFGDADQTKYYDSQSGSWFKVDINFAASNRIIYEGVELPVMPKKQLLEYKVRLDREVDRIDIREIQGT